MKHLFMDTGAPTGEGVELKQHALSLIRTLFYNYRDYRPWEILTVVSAALHQVYSYERAALKFRAESESAKQSGEYAYR